MAQPTSHALDHTICDGGKYQLQKWTTALACCIHTRLYPDVVLAGVGVLVRVASLGVVIVDFTLVEPGSDDVSDRVASANALVLHSKLSR